MLTHDWLDISWCTQVFITLVHFLWQGLLIAVIAELVIRSRPNASPDVRHNVYLTSLLVMAACPAITYWMMRAPMSLNKPCKASVGW